MPDALSDYGYNKSADATTLNSTSLTGFPAFVRLKEGTDSTGTGVPKIKSDASIDGKEDIGFFDKDGNPVDFYFTKFDTANGVFEGWVRTDLVRDGTLGLQIGYGAGSTVDEVSESTLWDGVPGLVARLSMNETGTIYDSTSNNHDEQNSNGSPQRGQSGVFGNSIYFGDGEAIDLDTSSNTLPTGDEARSFIQWIKPDSSFGDSNGAIYGYGPTSNSDNSHWRTILNDSDEDVGIIGQSNDVKFYGNYPAGSWSMVGASYDPSSSEVRIFDDGGYTGGGSPNNYNTNADNLRIAERNYDEGESYSGYTQELHFYDVAKSDDYMQTHWDMSPQAGYSLFSWNASETTSTKVTATPALGQGTPLTAQTTSILGNWRGQDDGRITERTQTKVQGEYAQKWQLDADKTTAEKATFVADQTMQPDLSTALGTNAGSFTQGTFGLHMQIDNTTVLRDTDTLQLKIGSSPNDYAVWTLDRSELRPDGEFTYYTFSHSDYDSITGTPDWTNADFYELTLFEETGNTTDTFIYVDYLTVSDRDTVGATGVGARRSNKRTVESGG